MCEILQHTCVCPYQDNPKVMLLRKIVCPVPVQCPDREAPPRRSVVLCNQFHIGGQSRMIPYHCAACDTEDPYHPEREKGRPAEHREHVQRTPAELAQAFGFMDDDFLTEFHHLAKKRATGRIYWTFDQYRTGIIDPDEEYTPELYLTGNDFIQDGNGELKAISNGSQRGIKHEEDPTPQLFRSDGERDRAAEHKQARAKQHKDDKRYRMRWDEGLREYIPGGGGPGAPSSDTESTSDAGEHDPQSSRRRQVFSTDADE